MRNENANDAASMYSTLDAPSAAISTPASGGPKSVLVCVAPSSTLFACEIARWSFPISSGRITRCDAKYGALKQPKSATSTSSTGNDSRPAAWRIGSDTISGTRARSATSMVDLAPIRETTVPRGTPSSATGASSNARTIPIFAGECVVTSTNHGSATFVIAEPTRETSSATRSASSPRLRRITPAPRSRRTR